MSTIQTNVILEHLESGKTLTPLQALHFFGCLRLSARILDLKDAGHNIKTTMIKLSTGKRVAQYELVKEAPEPEALS